MEHFELPANIKQIGSIGEGLRIYVEDYVCSYLYTYAEAGGYQERIALLVGRYLVIDNQPVLFISGAIQGKYTEVRNGLTLFTERSMDYAQGCVDQYFPGLKIVGWMQSQPSYGVYLNSGYIDVHISHFKKKYQVMFVMDPIEKTNAFYTYTKSGMTLEEAKGYFIYYDKNESMHEYMVQNKMDTGDTALTVGEEHTPPERPPAAVGLRARHIGRQEEKPQDRRMVNLLIGLSAVLFIVSFVMGAGLIQNQDRISTLERQVVQLSTSYRNIAQVVSGGNTASVFAEENERSIGEAISETAPPTENQTAPQVITEQIIAAPTSVPTEKATTESTDPLPEKYTVRDGDTLNSISLRFYGNKDMVERIMEYNNITDPNLIVSGTTLNLPAR
ncbi:MAG: LysM peptidoglycan-binding domain-containing protein [Clostridiales bacterium]|nr:LysM peptidoglycan-binding domain-containing protein [Clostridiales bacterium]